MDISQSQIVSFIWGIADDCLRDVFVRGQYRDVILPMVVLPSLRAMPAYKIDISIKETQKIISLLQERKQIIINDVVTGKVKVV